MFNIENIKNIHFIGIGGSGMSGIAEVLMNLGYKVSGSDAAENFATQHLKTLGANILQGHNSAHVNGADVVVYSGAIAKDNPELIAAQKKHIPTVARAQMLAELMRLRYGIAVAGTHGKTTTTSLTATLLAEGKLDPTFVIGGLLRSAGTHARLGSGPYFVAEADESDASFLFLHPKIVIVTNIDCDHLNHYRDFAHLQQTFLEFIHRLPEDGLAIVCSDDPVIQELLPQIQRPVLTYGFKETDAVRAVEYHQHGTQCHIKVERQNKTPLDVTLNLPGRHNVLNALAAIAVATHCGVNDNAIADGLNKYQGAGRRFQIYEDVKIDQGEILIIDDYGHHPREIGVTLDAIKQAWPERRLVLAFQPHRYTRTESLFKDFVKVLARPDILFLLDIYSAGENPIPGVTGKKLYEAIRKETNIKTFFVEKVEQLQQMLPQALKDKDILLIQGAGSIGKIAPQLADGILKKV